MAQLTSNINHLQPTAFKLSIDRKHFPNLEFFAQSVNHPSLQLTIGEMAFRQVQNVPFAGSSVSYGELSASILLDENMESYTEMHDWILRVLEEKNTRALDRTSTKAPTECDITLTVLTSHNNKSKAIRYKGCIPVSIGDIPFISTDDGSSFITFDVSFRFTSYELV